MSHQELFCLKLSPDYGKMEERRFCVTGIAFHVTANVQLLHYQEE